ncbi:MULTISPECIES: recombinase family protein [unclassified Geobacillus]|uniref:recombinase family protein n=1 Tax=unclassified Geobacillus TaxID=2642459 RepID=UPI000D372F3F|nr:MULTISPECIES: recombinase family protein [unclassified Geobacillus]PUF85793.1 recombinase family protein [Geobacillus sp. LYN3]TXK89038.1 recombinase family protein [Geobacillus sp. AYS3]
MRTALYIRVSTEDQARDGYSIQMQKEKLHAYCVSQGWDIEGFYIDDGYSAKDLERPAMKRMIENIKQGLIDCVLVYRLDRLTRSVLDLHNLLKLFDEHDCKFKSATEVYDTTTATGRMFITFVAALAQWERENTAERVKANMQQMVHEGKYPGGKVNFGYRLEEKKIVIDEQEAAIVRKMFDLYLEGNGDNRTATLLNRMGHRTRLGRMWTGKQVRDILTNQVYIGRFFYMDEYHDGIIPPIIEREKFETAQKMREGRRGKHPRQVASDYIFSGVLRCARCGRVMPGKLSNHTKKNGIYARRKYTCRGTFTKLCDMPMLDEQAIEEVFLRYIREMRDASAASEVAASYEQDSGHISRQIQDIETQLDEIKKRRKRLQLAFANEVISLEELKELTSEDRKIEKELQNKLEELKGQEESGELSPQELTEILMQFEENWNHLSDKEKKNLVSMFIKEIYVQAENTRPNRWRKRKVWIERVEFM